MFELIHRHKKLAAGVIAVASISFLFWIFTVQDIKQMFGLKRCVASVNGSCITMREFRYNLLRASGGGDTERLGILKDRVLSEMVQLEIISLRAKDLGVFTSSLELAEGIKTDRAFFEGGNFSMEAYEEMVERLGLTTEEYEDITRKFLNFVKLNKLFHFTNYMAEMERLFLDKISKTFLSGEAYFVKKENFKTRIDVSEKEIMDYYEKNKDKFKTEEVKIFRIWKTTNKEKAHKIYNSLKSNKGVHEGYEEIRVEGKNLNDLSELSKYAKKLTLHDRLYISKEGNQYVIVFLHSVIAPRIKEFNEVKDNVKNILLDIKAEKYLLKEINKLKNKLLNNEKIGIKPLNFNDSHISEFIKLFNISSTETISLIFSDQKVFGPYRKGDDYVLIRINLRKMSKDSANYDSLSEFLINSKITDLMTLYIEKAFRDADIKVNEEYLEKLQ